MSGSVKCRTSTWQLAMVVVFLGTAATACGTARDAGADESVAAAQSGLEQEGLDRTAEIRVETQEELGRMEEYVANRYEPSAVMRSLVTAEGRVVDCVDINRQPALRNPKLRGHHVATPPEEPAPTESDAGDDSRPGAIQNEAEALAAPLFDADDPARSAPARCPDGSVPIMKVTLEDLVRFRTLEDFQSGRRYGLEYPADEAHEYATAYKYVTNYGATSTVNIWAPYVHLWNEFSVFQLWVVAGSGSSKQTLEIGWQVYPAFYGTDGPILVVFTTLDGYQHGCYNGACGYFVQYSTTVYPGMEFGTVSSIGGDQYAVEMEVRKASSVWWVRFGSEWIGYYPDSIFATSGLRDHATKISFGGEIVNDRDTFHTRTDMGSGRYPSEWYGYAAYQRRLKYFTSQATSTDATGLFEYRTDAGCYEVDYRTDGNSSWGRAYVFLGGPGYTMPACMFSD